MLFLSFFVWNFGQPGGSRNAYIVVYQLVTIKYALQVVCFYRSWQELKVVTNCGLERYNI